MEQRLIELSDSHYIVVDDSEIKEGDYKYHHVKGIIKATFSGAYTNEFKITHSTPIGGFSAMLIAGVKELSLSEVEEVINGYSVEKMTFLKFPKNERTTWGKSYSYDNEKKREGYVEGFNAHKELVKDKLFTIEDLRAAFAAGDAGRGGYTYNRVRNFDGFDEYITKKLGYFWDSEKGYILHPKTEWSVEVTLDGKIVLL